MEEQDRILLKKFMDKVWPDYRNNVYRGLYRTYHPSTYSESFSNPMDNMVEAVDEIDVAINKGMSYGLISKDGSVSSFSISSGFGPPLEIHEGGNTEQMGWLPATLLFNVLWDIVEEFRCYCGEDGIDPDCKGKCMGEFPYLYEDYNNLHDYMKILESEGAPLDILLDEYPLQLNKIQLSPDYPYRPHEHNHNSNRLEEDIDKFLSRRLSVIKENIYTLSDGDLLGEGEQHKLERQMCELFDLHKHEASEHLFNWSIKDVIKEHDLTMNSSDNKRNELRDNLFDQLDETFGVFPHPDGELEFEGQPVAIYSFEFDEFVPFDTLYDPLSNLLDRGVDQESVELFIEIITEWVSYSMTEKPEMFNEETDIFGQGLMDPINPEDFEGTEEEWEELVNSGEPWEEKPNYDYTDGKTDPEKGFVAPSKEVTDNICNVENFCKEQGPITFGQLKALVEAATSKRIAGDMGRGVFKTLWRIIPFFIPQVLLAAVGVTATRAINKIVTPALKDTKGYKSWWGKVVLKAMDIAEGDYIPDVALGDDPLGKVFFISDGLLEMIKDKYKLKFARYVADVAASRPDSEPVPDWFVENLLRDYLNQKFLLDPPLQPKKGLEFEDLRTVNESKMSDIDLKKNKRLNEHEEPGLSPELEIGDVIRVVDIDREVESQSIKYNIPPPELRPEKFTPYAVVDKESNGSESKYPFRYTLVPEDKLEDYEKNLDRGYGDYETYEKLLFPWVHQWIYADTPMANKVDRLTISENTQSAYDNEDLCDELTISTEEELREKLEGMSIGEEDRYEIEELIEDMLSDTESLHPRLSSAEAETDFDISNMYGRKIQSILCTYEKKNINNLDEIDIDFKGTTLGKKNDKFTDGRPPKERSNYTQGVNEELTNRTELNPELDEGDHVKIISIDGEHANMPKRWEVYVVNSVHHDNASRGSGFYYGLYPKVQMDANLIGSILAGGGKPREVYLYRGDEWIKVENSKVNPLIKKLDGLEVEIDTVKYDLGYVDEETGESTGNLFFEITNPRFEPKMEQPKYVRNDMFHYDLTFTGEESGILVDWFNKEELEKMFNQDGIKGKLNKAIYENYLKLYGMKQMYVRVQEFIIDDYSSPGLGDSSILYSLPHVPDDEDLSENILDTFKVISELNKGIVIN